MELELKQNIINNINSNILNKNNYDFIAEPETKIHLIDKIILYFDGVNWKIILLDIFLSHSIIYDEYILNNEKFTISVIVCPVTLRAVILKGLFKANNYINNKLMLEDIENKNIITIDEKIKLDKHIIHNNFRHDVKIMTFRDAIIMTPDALFMNYKNEIKYIINPEYYINLLTINDKEINSKIYHPKTLVHLLQYKSKTTGEYKNKIIIGKDINQNNITGYDLKKSNLTNYLNDKFDVLIEKKGFIMPILWYIAKDEYIDTDIIQL